MANRNDILFSVGKTIAGVIVNRGGPHPDSLVFPIFADDSTLELYADGDEILPSFRCAREYSAVGWIRPYCSEVLRIAIDKAAESPLNRDRTGE